MRTAIVSGVNRAGCLNDMFEAFKEYLTSRGSIKSQYLPYYVRWVSACYEFFHLDPSTRLDAVRKQEFLAHMARRYEDWQVKQADHALRLYGYSKKDMI